MSPSLAALSAADGADFPGLPSGARLVVKRWGRGLPVPCLNASGHGSGDFVGLAERLDSDFEPIAVDQPGMNWSPPDRSAGLAPGKAGGLAPLDGAARFVIGHMESFFRAGKRGAVWFFAAVAVSMRSLLQRIDNNMQDAYEQLKAGLLHKYGKSKWQRGFANPLPERN